MITGFSFSALAKIKKQVNIHTIRVESGGFKVVSNETIDRRPRISGGEALAKYLKCCNKNVITGYSAYRIDNFKGFNMTFPVITKCPKCSVKLIGFVGYNQAQGAKGLKARFPESGLHQVFKSEKNDWDVAIQVQGVRIETADVMASDKATRGTPHVSDYTRMICKPVDAIYKLVLYGDPRVIDPQLPPSQPHYKKESTHGYTP